MLDTVKEIDAFLKPYNEEREKVNNAENPNVAYENYQQYVNANLELPPHITTPSIRPLYTIEPLTDELCVLKDENGNRLLPPNNIVELYNYATKELRVHADLAFKGDFSTVKDIDVTNEEINPDMIIVSGALAERYGNQALIISTDTSKLHLFKECYLSFLETAREYLKNPKDFVAAWQFVDRHPALWVRYTDQHINDWKTDGLLNKTYINVSRKKGKPLFMLEAGGAVEPDYTNHYHDIKLDTYAPTYEKLIIKYAKKLHKRFYLDGTYRDEKKW